MGFARVSAAIPYCRVADVRANAERTLALAQASHAQGDAVVLFPELGLTGYTARDLLSDAQLLADARLCLDMLVHESASLQPLIIVGLPLAVDGALYNVAAAIHGGELLGFVPKTYLPSDREFEETRWFRSGLDVPAEATVRIGDKRVPLGVDILFEAENVPGLVVGVEICEDLWAPVPVSAVQALSGATVIANLSASNITVDKADLRRLMVRSASVRGKCGYLYVAAGPDESSTDLAFDGDALIYENGRELAHSRRFDRTEQLVCADIDLEWLIRERRVTTTFGDCARVHRRTFRRQGFIAPPSIIPPLRRTVDRQPFVPDDQQGLHACCGEVLSIQTQALATRATAIGRPQFVLGISGGLDSTHAALVVAATLDAQSRPRTELHCVTMPGLGTTAATQRYGERLAMALGATLHEIPIGELSKDALVLVEHPAAAGADDVASLLATLRERPQDADVTVENVQARLRTLVLMTLANQVGGIVVGTGDLSEKALGWSTYAGDQISMYDINAGVPKTLIQAMMAWVVDERADTWAPDDPAPLKAVLRAILEAPISPELRPLDADGRSAQRTEDAIGPYVLHDFFLYHFVGRGARPGRVLDLAHIAFAGAYDGATIKTWLTVFVRRFFANQFKRSCTPDGPKVGPLGLSPRGDWRMPSDACVRTWVQAIADYPDEG